MRSPPDPVPPSGPASLRLGVVGHTSLRPEDLPALTASVRAIFSELRGLFPSVRLQLLSSLAEGADQLCAEAALAAGIDVIAPLPFPVELYRTRFRSDAARLALDRLARHPAVNAFCLDAGPGATGDFSAMIADDRRRRQRYVDAARHVVQRSDALVAVWDEGREPGPSLTAEIVAWRTRAPGGAEAGAANSAEPGLVFSIYAPRAGSGPEPGRVPGETRLLAGPGAQGVPRAELLGRLVRASGVRSPGPGAPAGGS